MRESPENDGMALKVSDILIDIWVNCEAHLWMYLKATPKTPGFLVWHDREVTINQPRYQEENLGAETSWFILGDNFQMLEVQTWRLYWPSLCSVKKHLLYTNCEVWRWQHGVLGLFWCIMRIEHATCLSVRGCGCKSRTSPHLRYIFTHLQGLSIYCGCSVIPPSSKGGP